MPEPQGEVTQQRREGTCPDCGRPLTAETRVEVPFTKTGDAAWLPVPRRQDDECEGKCGRRSGASLTKP